MYKLFYKYKPVIIKGLIFISLIIANFASGALSNFFLGAVTGAAMISFGQSLAEIKLKKQIDGYHAPLGNK
ncbi:MAG: hypothetical protein ABI472_09810 [Ginsengibacter sp.]